MAAETLAFAYGFDNDYLIKHGMERILGRNIPFLMFTDSKLPFEALTSSRNTTERRLMVDVAAIRGANLEGTISTIGLILSECNPADGLTELECNDMLQNILLTLSINHPVE